MNVGNVTEETWREYARRPRLYEPDIAIARSALPPGTLSAVENMTFAYANTPHARPRQVQVIATEAEYFRIKSYNLTGGRVFSPQEAELGSPVVVIGTEVASHFFAGLDPLQVVRKFVAFGDMEADSPRAEIFVAVEDWLNDGVPLAAPVARECLAGWYGANTPGRGDWRVAGEAVQPSTLDLPTLVVLPDQDRIVPPNHVGDDGET